MVKYIALAIFAILPSVSIAAQTAADSLVFFDGDTSCSGNVAKFIRVPNPFCQATQCFATSQGKNLPQTTSESISCVSDVNSDFPAQMLGKKYAVVSTYSSGTCDASTVAQVSAFYVGACSLIGNSYSYSTCGADGSLSVYTGCSAGCQSNCVLTVQGKDDGVCYSGVKYQCKTLTGSALSGNKPSMTYDNSAGVSGVAPLAVAASSLFMFMFQ